jgi:NAD(P)-dependent dehydrogenase (short-subunit alcohol dehydrogenase family)
MMSQFVSVTQAEIQPLDLDNLFLYNDGTYNGFQAYKNSKLANIMFTYELSRRLEGTGVKVNVVDPGTYDSIDFLLTFD